MKYFSTRNKFATTELDEAILQGLAPDGGLYMPARLPPLPADAVDGTADFAQIASLALAPFFETSALKDELPAMAEAAFDFDAPLAAADFEDRRLTFLKLHHGPTAAFKDFGARFLTEALRRLGGGEPVTLLVATSGDTGGAVAAAAAATENLRACILFPKSGVSPLQERQLTCWPDNVLSLRIDGDFDACQALVKRAFLDTELRAAARLTSANSINIARLLAQLVYYVKGAFEYEAAEGAPAGFIVPTGNLGNALACVWAKLMGAPIDRVHFAVNANRTLADFAETGDYHPRASVKTLSNAMDVGAPSNFERLAGLLGEEKLDLITAGASSHDDKETAAAMRAFHAESGGFICPHTAVGLAAWRRMNDEDKVRDWIIAATADASKFNEIVENVVGAPAPLAPALEALRNLPISVEDMPPDEDALKRRLRAFCAP